MKAVLLAGGKGTRLRPFTTAFPKPLVPLDDTPVIEILLRRLALHGITDLTVVTGHLAELMQAFLGDGSRFGVAIEYFQEETPLDTAGCLGVIEPPTEPFLVMNGDLLTNLDFNNLANDHRRHRPIATVATYLKQEAVDLGVIVVDGDGALVDYREKPVHEYLVSMGIYCFDPGICRFVDPGERLAMPELILRLRDAGEKIMCYREDCYWLDVGRPDDYAQATEQFQKTRSLFLPSQRAA
jgi:NDP-sugar pyrophosphorylase family protein